MEEKELKQALIDADCPSPLQDRILDLYRTGHMEEALKLLQQHRCTLLMALHQAQKPIDILDFILHDLKKR